MVLLNVSHQVLSLKIAAMCSAERLVQSYLARGVITQTITLWKLIHTFTPRAVLLPCDDRAQTMSYRYKFVLYPFCLQHRATVFGSRTQDRAPTVPPWNALKVISYGCGPTEHEHSRCTVPRARACVRACVCVMTFAAVRLFPASTRTVFPFAP